MITQYDYDGSTIYYLTAWANDAEGTDFSLEEFDGALFIGRTTNDTAEEITDWTAYEWEPIDGEEKDFATITALNIAVDASESAQDASDAAGAAQDTAQTIVNHFWTDDEGAHVTVVTQGEFIMDPDNGGMNSLTTSDGNYIRNGRTILAEYTAAGVKIGQDGGTQMAIDSDSMETTDENGVTVLRLGYVDAAEAVIDLSMTPSTTPLETATLALPVAPIWASGFGMTMTAYSSDGTEHRTIVDTSRAGTYSMDLPFATWSVVASDTEVTVTCQSYSGSATLPPTLSARYYGTTAAPVFSIGVNDVEGAYSTAFGADNEASGISSHAEGTDVIASGNNAHAEGEMTQATGSASHAEGFNTRATGTQAHAEGGATHATGSASHAEGAFSTASASNAHAEGISTTASGTNAHAQGTGTTARSRSQMAMGEYNEIDQTGTSTTRGTHALIVGNGTSDTNRSNALVLGWDGNLTTAGDIEDGSGNMLSSKQDTLVSGTNIKTINNQSLLGSGNISVGGGGGGITFDDVYPVGSIYMSANAANPGTLFGGTWVQIEDTFLLSAGSTYTAGTSGGSASHTHTTGDHLLTAAESGMPSHTHGDTFSIEDHASKTITGGAHGHTANYRSVYNGSSNYSAVTGSGGTSTTTNAIVNTSGSHSHTISAYSHTLNGSVSTASAKAATSVHNHGDTGSASSLPPYFVVYVWQRTA